MSKRLKSKDRARGTVFKPRGSVQAMNSFEGISAALFTCPKAWVTLELMENTGGILFGGKFDGSFGDDQARWYVALGDRWIGPMTAEDVYGKVLAQEITWAHFVWTQGQAHWQRICDTPTFQPAVPRKPSREVMNAVKEASKPGIRKSAGRRGTGSTEVRRARPPRAPMAPQRIWFLYYNNTQFGPFSAEEVSNYLRIGKLHGKVFGWMDGMTDWVRLEKIGEFDEAVAESEKARSRRGTPPPRRASGTGSMSASAKSSETPARPVRKEQRVTPRKPLVAKILLASDDSVIVGMCRDISIGGMQVLTDRIPGAVGARVKLNVSPTGSKSSASKKAPAPFVAEGVIVRHLEDGRGFSFRFDKLSESARRNIERYIQSVAG